MKNISTLITNNHVSLITPEIKHAQEFLNKANVSHTLHIPWTKPPLNNEEYLAYLERLEQDNQAGFLICLKNTGEVIGVININEIVRGTFNSGYLGYYCFAGFEKRGLMREGLRLVLEYAFNTMALHRLEANIQPNNLDSIALATHCGFIKEGFSKEYLKINGQWQDHVRYAITAEIFNSPISFTPLTKNDLPLLHQWFELAHIKQWYARGKTYSLEEIHDKYLPRIEEPHAIPNFIVSLNNKPIGYIQSYLLTHYLPEGVLNYNDTLFDIYNQADIIGLDLFIADDSRLNKGLGSQILNQFIDEKIKGFFKTIIVDPHSDNKTAIHFFLKNYFQEIRQSEYLLMVRNIEK